MKALEYLKGAYRKDEARLLTGIDRSRGNRFMLGVGSD